MDLPPEDRMVIESARLTQEPMRREHAAAMFPVLADPSLYAFTGGSAPGSIEQLEEIYEFRQSRRSPDGKELWLNWMVRERETNQAIGYTQATIETCRAYIAWVIGVRWQGSGYASEAATALVAWLVANGVPEVRACVYAHHKASQRVAQNAGLVVTQEKIDGEDVWTNRPSPGSIQ